MFITAVCGIFLTKLRWPKNKNLFDLFCTWCGRPEHSTTPSLKLPIREDKISLTSTIEQLFTRQKEKRFFRVFYGEAMFNNNNDNVNNS